MFVIFWTNKVSRVVKTYHPEKYDVAKIFVKLKIDIYYKLPIHPASYI